MAGRGAGQDDLRDVMTMSEIDERHSHVLAMQDAGFDVEIAGKVEMLFDRVSLLRR